MVTASPHLTSRDLPHLASRDLPHLTSRDLPHLTSRDLPHLASRDFPHLASRDSPHHTSRDSPHHTSPWLIKPVTSPSGTACVCLQSLCLLCLESVFKLATWPLSLENGCVE